MNHRWCKSMKMFTLHGVRYFARLLRIQSNVGVLFLLLNGSIAMHVRAQESSGTSLADGMDALVQQQIKSYNIPALSVTATRQGNIIFSKRYGWADLENRVPVTDKTLFRIGSITKTITATAALILAERGQLNLDKQVQHYCSAFPEKPWSVTTRELLAHMGGVRGFRSQGNLPMELYSDVHYERVADSIALFANDPLVAKPGTRYLYSNYGYDLIGCVLEGASGKRFDDLLQNIVFLPAAMTATALDDRLQIIPGRSHNYAHARDRSIRNAKCIDTSNRTPAAGLLSTTDDLARFVLALESGKLLSTTS